jgi:hypothetical protein
MKNEEANDRVALDEVGTGNLIGEVSVLPGSGKIFTQNA